MNDITALMATMKAAAENLDGDTWHSEGASVYGGAYDVGDTVCHDHIVDCENVNGESLVAEFIAAANPANVLALVEALEARDKQIAKDVEIKARLCRESNSLFDRLRAAEKRIAELESRTVTVKLSLPRRKTADDYVDDTFEPCDLAAIYNACRLECEVKFKKALTAAGINVEVE